MGVCIFPLWSADLLQPLCLEIGNTVTLPGRLRTQFIVEGIIRDFRIHRKK